MQRIIRSQILIAVRLFSNQNGPNLQKIIGATKTVEECTKVPLKHSQRPAQKLQGKGSGAGMMNEDVILCAYQGKGNSDANDDDECCEPQPSQCAPSPIPSLMSGCPQPEGKWETGSKNMKYTITLVAGLAVFIGTVLGTKDTVYPYDPPF